MLVQNLHQPRRTVPQPLRLVRKPPNRRPERLRLDAFLRFNEYDILTNAGSISHEVAKRLAEDHYEKFRITQDTLFESDFDIEVAKLSPPRASSSEGES